MPLGGRAERTARKQYFRRFGAKDMSAHDTAYYRQRAADERALALKSEHQNVALIHQELARQYQALVDRAELRPTLNIAFTRKLTA